MQKQRVKRLRQLSKILDSRFEGPLGIRFGLDPLIGLIPGFGDILTSMISFFIVAEAYRLGCTPATLMRMILNIFLENLVKVVPVLGHFFDFFWKSNLKNIDLLEKHIQAPDKTNRASLVFFALLGLCFILVITLSLALGIWMLVWIIRLIQGM